MQMPDGPDGAQNQQRDHAQKASGRMERVSNIAQKAEI